jgi:hypothetical protein
VVKKLKGRRGGGPVASQAAGGDRLGHMERGNLGARVAAWGVMGGFGKTRGRRAHAAAGERPRARRGAGRRRGKRGRERGGWPVGQPTG